MTVATFYDTLGNGSLQIRDQIGWSEAVNSASATEDVTHPHVYMVENQKSVGSNLFYCSRYFFTFLTGDILKTASSIESAVLSLYGYASYSNPDNQEVCLCGSTQTNPVALAKADYGKKGDTEFATRIAMSSWNQAGYNDFVLNASGIAALNKTAGGYSKFCVRSSRDYDFVEPGTGDTYVGCYYHEDADANKYPKLVVTYIGGFTGSFLSNFV
jgi:hypothetical protein